VNRGLGLGIVLALAGCAGWNTEPPAPSLTIGVLAAPSGLDPALHDEPATNAIARDVLATLVHVRPDTFAIEPGIASSWSVAPDGTTWTFALRSGVEFSDGSAVDATAVKANFDRWRLTKDPNHGDGPYPQFEARFGGYDDASRIVSVDAPTPQTVVIRLREPYAPLLRDLALPAFGIGSPKALAYSLPQYDEAPTGSGPYRIDDVAALDHVTLVRNPQWTQAAPAFASSTIRFIPDAPTARLSLEKSDVDAVFDPDSAGLRDAALRSERLVRAPSSAVALLAFDTTRPPFDDERLRRAIWAAVDAGAVARAAGTSAAVAHDVLLPSMRGAAGNWTSLADRTAARATLRTVRAAAPIALYYPQAGTPALADPSAVAQEIAGELRTAGLVVDPRPTSPPIALPAPGTDGALGLIVVDCPTGEPDDVFSAVGNLWSDPEYRRLLAASRAAGNDHTRDAALRALDRAVRDRAVVMPLVDLAPVSVLAPAIDLDAYPMFEGAR